MLEHSQNRRRKRWADDVRKAVDNLDLGSPAPDVVARLKRATIAEKSIWMAEFSDRIRRHIMYHLRATKTDWTPLEIAWEFHRRFELLPIVWFTMDRERDTAAIDEVLKIYDDRYAV
jgi:hypothetical protein